MTDFVPGDFVSDHFGPASKTGLVKADFAVTIMKDGQLAGIDHTIIEVGSSFYFIEFETDADNPAVWSIDVLETPNKSRFQKTFVLKDAETADVIQQNGVDNSVPRTIDYVRVLTDQIDQRQRGVKEDTRAIRDEIK